MADQVLPNMLDKDMAKIVQRELENNDVNIILGERVEEIQGRDGKANGIKTNTERKIDSDLIVLDCSLMLLWWMMLSGCSREIQRQIQG